MKRSTFAFVMAMILLAGLTAALAPPGGGLDLSWHTIDGGGGSSTGGSFELHGTIGQHDAGETMVGGGFELSGGFWPGGSPPTSMPATLTDFTVSFGTLISGTLQDLVDSDNSNVQARSRLGFVSTRGQQVDVRVGAVTTVLNGASLDISVEGRISQPGGTGALRLRNWSTNSFEQVHTYPIGSTEIVVTIDDVSAANRIRQSDGRIELVIRQTAVAIFSASFDSFTDQVIVSVE